MTLEEVQKKSDDEVDVMVRQFHHPGEPASIDGFKYLRRSTYDNLAPRYTKSLDAMHAAEEVMDARQQELYRVTLMMILKCLLPSTDHKKYIDLIRAKARPRAEAFVVAMTSPSHKSE
jgi:hypothetical protein